MGLRPSVGLIDGLTLLVLLAGFGLFFVGVLQSIDDRLSALAPIGLVLIVAAAAGRRRIRGALR